MGPKKGGETSKKTEKKNQDKVIEDRTFGLKNKNKSKAVQKFVKSVESTVRNKDGRGGANAELNKMYQEKAEKKKAKEEEAFLNSLYKTVTSIKQEELEDGQEAKNVLCAFFKAGCCEKGDECEFSHDLNIEFNQGTFDIYTDLRDVKKTMGVEFEINKIAEEKEKKRSRPTQSNIICKFFLDAVQKKVYGWKWECPNGDNCHYKHCLPQGYRIVTNKDKLQEEMTVEEYINLEEQIDAERDRIGKSGTPVNEGTFLEWKKRRDEFRKQNKEFEEKKKKSGLTGVQLFKNQSNLFKDDENAEDVEREDNQLDDDVNLSEQIVKTDQQMIEEIENDLKGIKINAELFQEENLDDLDGIEDDDNPEAEVTQKRGMIIEEDEKENDH
jgi:hypothetical protein